uniref:Tumor necrosis factor ligand superfamily member 11 n=1 Tax=Gallus gallus TaxID=9031 RepID=A3RF19_CHICK|nr:tumor necrosis factor ligand superfamily member 11 [Gallus gallus]ABN69113.1 tumor necrosis factor ligand superfamily member 11 [Gallus gallus]|eukprot:NP_001076830.1 tumor necrosis factor ligand superfamily member 11 [Gallus gallus]
MLLQGGELLSGLGFGEKRSPLLGNSWAGCLHPVALCYSASTEEVGGCREFASQGHVVAACLASYQLFTCSANTASGYLWSLREEIVLGCICTVIEAHAAYLLLHACTCVGSDACLTLAGSSFWVLILQETRSAGNHPWYWFKEKIESQKQDFMVKKMDPSRISKEDAHCVRMLFRSQESIGLQDTPFENQEVKLMPESCRRMKRALQRAVQKEVQRILGKESPRPEKAAMEAIGMELYRRNKPEKQPFAHLIIDDKNILTGTRKVNLTSWHHNKGQANLSNMTFSDGKLIVNQDGFYYLYANICFRHHETSGNLTKRGLQLMVYMTKTNLKIRRSDVLMKGGSTKYWSGNSEFHFYSVNIGGFLKLKTGDMISIQVSNPLLLDSSQEATYFGAFKVRDLD